MAKVLSRKKNKRGTGSHKRASQLPLSSSKTAGSPAQEPRPPTTRGEIILASATGEATAVLTETIWALAHESPPIIPDRVIVFTTTKGRERIQRDLLAGAPSVWEQLQAQLQREIPAVEGKLRFGDSDEYVRVFRRGDKELEDIRTSND